jgi:microcystin-dependent protein
MPTNLPTSEQAGNLDNISVTRAEFRAEIGVLLEYIAQALGNVSGTYTVQTVNPEDVTLSGTPKVDLDTIPAAGDDSQRIPSTSWVKRTGQYFSNTPPINPPDGMLWIDNTNTPYELKVRNGPALDWDILSGFPAGTRMLFQQSAAPTGWTKDVSQNNKALRVTSGNVTTGGNLSFTDAFASRGISGSVANHTLTVAQMPVHSHGFSDPGHSHGINDPGHTHRSPWNAKSNSSKGDGGNSEIVTGNVRNTTSSTTGISVRTAFTGASIGNQGGNGAHNHGFSGNNLDMRVQFIDVIFAQKD